MMRVLILGLIAAASLTYGLFQHWEMVHRDALIKQLNSQVIGAGNRERRSQADLELSRKRQLELEENVERLTAERDAALSRAKEPTAGIPGAVAESEGSPKKDGGGNPFAKMFQSEEGRKMMKSQAGVVVRMQYADLARKLNLSTQDADQLLALLGDRQNALADSQFKLLADGKIDEAEEKAIIAESEAVKREYDDKLKTILGEEKFRQLRDYEKTIGDRMLMTQYEQQFNASGAPLQGGQKDALLQIMQDERKKSPPQSFDQSGQNWGKGMSLLRDDAALERYFQQEDEYHRRVLGAATNTLNPDQINALQQAFKQMQDMQKLGMKMSREMFAPTKDEATPVFIRPSSER